MTASKATLCAGVARGKRRVWPRRTWCSSCITRTKRWASVWQCSRTKAGLMRRTGRRSQLTQAVGTSSLASTRKSWRRAPRAWLRAGTASRTRRTRSWASAAVVIGSPRGRTGRGPTDRPETVRDGAWGGRAGRSAGTARRAPRRGRGACRCPRLRPRRRRPPGVRGCRLPLSPARDGVRGAPGCASPFLLARGRRPRFRAGPRRRSSPSGRAVPWRGAWVGRTCSCRRTRKRSPGRTARETVILELGGTDMLWSTQGGPLEDGVVMAETLLPDRGPGGRGSRPRSGRRSRSARRRP